MNRPPAESKMNGQWKKFINEKELKTVGIVICITEHQEFLIIRRSKIDKRRGEWTFPGGHVDDADGSIEAGAIRELYEETNLKCSIKDLLYLGEFGPEKFYFLTQEWNGEVNIDKPNPKTGEIEHDDYKWLTLEEIENSDFSSIKTYILRRALDTINA